VAGLFQGDREEWLIVVGGWWVWEAVHCLLVQYGFSFALFRERGYLYTSVGCVMHGSTGDTDVIDSEGSKSLIRVMGL